MAAFIGVSLAIAVALFARLVGMDRDRAFYATVLVVVGSLYVLFAVLGGGTALTAELIGFGVFAGVAAVGFRTSEWLVAAGLAGHGLFDMVHAALVANPGVPLWWPEFCGAYDIAAAACLAAIIVSRRGRDGRL